MKSSTGGFRAWAVRLASWLGLCLCAVVALPATATADGVSPKGVPTSESELRAVEERLLGAEHAAAHAAQRRSEKTARFSSDAGSKMLSETTVSSTATLSGAAAADVGEWSSVFPLRRSGDPSKSVPAIHAAVLPTGKVIWFGYRLDDGVRYKTESFAVLFDPVTKRIEDIPPPNDPRTGKPVALYCGGMSLMADGRLLVTGGYLDYHTTTTGVAAPNAYSGLNQVWTFDPYTKRWQRHEDMGKGRWYPTQMLMPDGRTMIVQGLDSTGEDYNRQVEVFDPRKPLGQEIDLLDRELTTTEDGDYYPHMFWMPSGRGLLAGPDRVQSYFIARPAPLTFRTTDFANPLRRRTWGAGLLMPLQHNSTTGTMWQMGGSDGPQRDKPNTNTVEAFDEASPGAWTSAPSQRVARSHQNAVMLPTGAIAAIGGGYGNRGTNWDSGPEHRQMELYDPGTRTWKLGPAQAEGRSYHSTAVLLPDGSVLSAGDDRLPEHALDSYEIYKPPYFFQGERPVIDSSPSSTAWDRTIWVGTPDTDIERAVLVAPSATTHAVEMHQRVINLPARKRADGVGYDIDMPTSTDVALPGHHMLFLIDTQGRPSHAAWIRLDSSAPVQEPPSGGGGDTTPPPAPTASPVPGTYTSDQSVALAGEAGATIRYTIDGAVPTATTGTVYSAPISVTGAAATATTRTIRAVAVDAAGNVSQAATLVYTIDKSTGGTRTLVINPDADAFVRQATPTSNNGSATTLRVDTTDGGGLTHSYVRFNVPALAADETIRSAALSLNVGTSTEETAPGTDNGPAVWATSTSWTESTITWNNGRPARSGSVALGNFGRMDLGRVSTPVSGVTTSGVKSFELAPESGDLLITSSRQDATAANRPQLVLTIASDGGGDSTSPPAAPTGLSASAGDARVALDWAASSGATGYDVYRASGGGSLTRVGSATPTTTATSFTDTGLTNGTQYTYAVRAINSAGASGNSNTVTATPVASTSSGTRTVTLTPEADTHIRQAAPTTAHGSETRLRVDLTDSGASGSEARSYVRFNVPALAAGESIQSARLSVFVADATDNGPAVWKTGTSWSESAMTWNSGRPARSGTAAVGDFAGMALGRREAAVSGVTGSGPVSFELMPDGYNLLTLGSREDATAANRPQLVLTIASDGGGDSTSPPAAPTGLSASAGDARVALDWAASSGATGYDVYRASGGGSLTRVGSATPTTTATSFTDTGLTNGTQYTYAVRAINSAGASGNSNTVTATPVASTSSGTRTVTLTPEADVHIRQAAPTTTHGSVTRMSIDLTDTGAAGSEARSYLRFNVPALAAGETIQSASLSVVVTDATTDGPAIWKTATSWSESTMTWNSGRPARSGLAAVGNFVDMPLGRRSVAVSDVPAGGPVSFELMPDGYNLLVVASREDTTAGNRPQLTLTIATS